MSYCVFGNVIKTILSSMRDDGWDTQLSVVLEIFRSFYENDYDYSIEPSLISRWVNGKKPVSPDIKQYYLDPKNTGKITEDLRKGILPHIVDIGILIRSLYELLTGDNFISEKKKDELSSGFPYESDDDKCAFIGRVIVYTLEKKEYLLDNAPAFIGSVHDHVIGVEVPPPCKTFCGRKKQLGELHDLLVTDKKVFVAGIPGIGKSEFIKAYAKAYRKEYRDILYFNYTGDLKSMITGAMFADDTDDDHETLFRRHHKYFHNLGTNILIIIDNFNVTEQTDKFLSMLMNYNCCIVFTTRSVFDQGTTYTLSEMEDTEILYTLVSHFYADIEKYRSCIIDIIEAVHHHTLAVELAARLLQKGLLTPEELLEKLRENCADPGASDKVKVQKDGTSTKATYYEHISRLCSLGMLDDDMKNIIRNMVFVPENGIRSRRLVKWMGMADMNAVNDLIELGLLRNTDFDVITLHPMIRDLAVKDVVPEYSLCSGFIGSIHKLCLNVGQYTENHNFITNTVLNIIRYAVNDDIPSYIMLLIDALGFMESYSDEYGMYLAVGELHNILNDKEIGTAKDRALMYNYEARCKSVFESNDDKAIEIQKKALKLIPQITDPVAVANLYMNMGVLYHDKGSIIKAMEYMGQAISLLEENKTVSGDYIAMKRNYATLLAEQGKSIEAHTILMDTAHIAVAADSSELAGLLFDAACIDAQLHFYEESIHLFNKAFAEYAKFLDQDDLDKRKQGADYLLRMNGCDMLTDTITYLE